MGTLKINESSVKVALSVYLFKEGEVYHAYSPELDLVGYDTTEEGAKQSLEVVLREYLDYAFKEGTLERDLLAHGWQKTKDGVSKPKDVEVMRLPQVRKVLMRPEYSKYSMPVML